VKTYKENSSISVAAEEEPAYMTTFSSQEEAELYRLKRDMNRSDMDKFRLFTQMLRRNAMYKRASISDNTTK